MTPQVLWVVPHETTYPHHYTHVCHTDLITKQPQQHGCLHSRSERCIFFTSLECVRIIPLLAESTIALNPPSPETVQAPCRE